MAGTWHAQTSVQGRFCGPNADGCRASGTNAAARPPQPSRGLWANPHVQIQAPVLQGTPAGRGFRNAFLPEVPRPRSCSGTEPCPSSLHAEMHSVRTALMGTDWIDR